MSDAIWALLVTAGLLLWVGVALILDEWMHRHQRPSLSERLRPYVPPTVADEAEAWLSDLADS